MDYESYVIGTTVLSGLFIIPLTVLWFITFCLARRRNDPARTGIAWLKAAFPIWTLYCILATAANGIVVWVRYSDDAYRLRRFALDEISEACSHVFITGIFFKSLGTILIFITLVELASGISLCLNGGQATASRKGSRIAILVWGSVLLVLAIALLGLRQSYTVRLYDENASIRNLAKDSLTISRLMIALDILMWITSLPIVVLACHVVNKAKDHPILRTSAVLLLTASLFLFLRLIITMAVNIHYILGGGSTSLFYSDSAANTQYIVTDIVEPFFEFVCTFVLFVLLFVLAVRKHKGLWSVARSDWAFTAAAPVVYYAPPGTVPVVPVPVQYPPATVFAPGAPGGEVNAGAGGQPTAAQGLPAYLAVAQQKQQAMMQQQQRQQGQGQGQGYHMPPQQ